MILILEVLALLGIGYAFWKNQERIGIIAPILVLVGGISNLVDRLVLGCVRDFSVVPWFPAFNLGDVYLTVGTVMLLCAWYFPSVAETKEKG
jgi:signal peptidase II